MSLENLHKWAFFYFSPAFSLNKIPLLIAIRLGPVK